MNTYPIEKYRFIVYPEKRQVIAITHDAGKIIRGVATCAPEDEFDEELGKRIAAAKANIKVAKRRSRRASELYIQAVEEVTQAQQKLEHYKQFLCDSHDKELNANMELFTLIGA